MIRSGKTRRCWISRRGGKSVSFGPELVINGTFDTVTTGWTPTGATLAVVGAQLQITSTALASNPAYAQQDIAGLTNGATYRIQALQTPGTTTYARVELSGATTAGFDFGTFGANISQTFVAGTTALSIFLEIHNGTVWNPATGTTALFDNISLKKLN